MTACRDQTFSRANEWHSLDCVKVIQALLDQEQGDHLIVDGYYGPLTEEAVKRFQEAHGLKVDGIVGPETWAVLDPAPQGRRIVAAAPLTVDPQLFRYLVDIGFGPAGSGSKQAVHTLPHGNGLPIGEQFDTGAFEWTLTEDLAAQAGIEKGQQLVVAGVTGNADAWDALADVWVGDQLFENTHGVILGSGSTSVLWGARFAITRGFSFDANIKSGKLIYYVED